MSWETTMLDRMMLGPAALALVLVVVPMCAAPPRLNRKRRMVSTLLTSR